MLPASASIMEGAGKFSMQLIGRESRVRQGQQLAASPPAAHTHEPQHAVTARSRNVCDGVFIVTGG